jgi:hypothetical protein
MQILKKINLIKTQYSRVNICKRLFSIHEQYAAKIGAKDVEKSGDEPISFIINKSVESLKREIYFPHIQLKNINTIFKSSMDVIKEFEKNKDRISYDVIFQDIFPFLEKWSSRFDPEQLIKLTIALVNNNIGHVRYFTVINYHIGKQLYLNKGVLMPKQEDVKFTKLLFNYFSITSEISMMSQESLNFIMEYFGNYSGSLIAVDDTERIPKGAEVKNLQTIYDFVWLSSLSIASILCKRIDFPEFEPFIEKESNLLNEKAAKGLKRILNYLDKYISADTNFSEKTHSKVRLFKSLYYLELEGINIPNNLKQFMKSFAPFSKLNVEQNISNSNLENQFEKILHKCSLKFEKEKKLNFCQVDFFVEPDFVLEVNGPSHYVFTAKHKDGTCTDEFDFPIAKDLLKRRVLELEKYEYLQFSHKEINRNPEEVASRLDTRLRHINNQNFMNSLNESLQKQNDFINNKKEEINSRKIIQRIKNSQYLI